jgi:AcrR family transcriptional regulator
VATPTERPSARRTELLDRAYAYALEHGLADLSLRPLAQAIGSSPGVLIFLFGSKEGLIRELIARARADELALLDRLRDAAPTVTARAVWGWLAAPAHRSLLVLWAQAYTRSLGEPDGPWAGFARATVEDWLALLTDAGDAHPTLTLAVLRGALLDLLATGDQTRIAAAIERYLRLAGYIQQPGQARRDGPRQPPAP